MSHHSHPTEKLSPGRLGFRIVLATVIVGLLVSYSASFQVSEGYKAVVTRFGEPKRSIEEAGFFWKYPWPIEQAHQIDVRRRVFDTAFAAMLTGDQKNVILLSYVIWRVEDPLLFLQSLGARDAAEQKLEGMVTARENFYLGQYDLTDLVSTNADQIRTMEIEDKVLVDVAADAAAKFGIRVEQVGVKRIAYPEENMTAVLEQMRAERNAEAKRLREEGITEAQRITDDAMVKAAETMSRGSEEAGKIRGEAEKLATEIYAKANTDPVFYSYWRKLEALKNSLRETSTLILTTKEGVFGVLQEPPELLEATLKSASPGAPGTAGTVGKATEAAAPKDEAAPAEKKEAAPSKKGEVEPAKNGEK